MSVLIPGGIGVLLTVICLSKAVNYLFEQHYSVAFHAIVGIVVAATLMIVPFESFLISGMNFLVNTICLVTGVFIASLLDQMNGKVEKN